MKVAFLAESPADRKALTILTEAVLGRKTEPISHKGLEHRGWPAIRTVLPSVLKQLHYHTDAQGFALIVDSDLTPPHLLPEHELPNPPDDACRLCQLRLTVEREVRRLSPRPGGLPPLRIALGLAVPSIEAWLLCGDDSRLTEANWISGLREGKHRAPYTTSDLKQRLYKTSRPSLAVETLAMGAAAFRLAQDIRCVEALFPHGFGVFARSLRKW